MKCHRCNGFMAYVPIPVIPDSHSLLIPDICSGRNRTLESERSDAGFF
jgi:hypothetical protein